EDDVVRDPSLSPSSGIFRPQLRQVECEVDWYMLGSRRDAEADADLAVGDLTSGLGVLALNADRMFTLLQEPRVVDDPRRDGLLLLQRFDRVFRTLPPHETVAPRTAADEVQEIVVHPLAHPLIAGYARGDRLDALALALPDDSERVGRERSPLFRTTKVLADPLVEV